MFAKGKAAIGGSRAIVSESNADVYMSSVDGYLSLYGWNFCGSVPGFQAVYGALHRSLLQLCLTIGAQDASCAICSGHLLAMFSWTDLVT